MYILASCCPGVSLIAEARETPFQLPSINISEEWLFDPSSLSISHNNQYAAVLLIERGGIHHNARRRVHFWSITKAMYLGSCDVQGPK